MNWVQCIRRWNRERRTLAALHRQLEEINVGHAKAIESARKQSRQDYEEALAQRYHEARIPLDQMEAIGTVRRLRAALKFGVPVERKSDDSHFWEWSAVTNEFLLTIDGHKALRREIAFEREIALKPWLTLFAVGISFLSLVVSVAAFIDG